MPDHIKMLADNVTHMIAAGEVVEGPHSVVKELIENAIDAESRHIDIKIEDSGFSRIVVSDDGHGIFRDDIVLSVREHATSKIVDIYDIQSISSYGFRGEALSSIAAVSDITVLSRRSDEQFGSRLENRNGTITVTDYAGSVGTTVIVENIFFNIPARKKFQKSPQAESRQIREVVVKSAIPNYKIAFSCIINDKKVIDCAAVQDRGERLKQIFGIEEMNSLLKESLSDISVSIEGYISKPHCAKASRNLQYLFVNDRPVEMKNFSFFLSKGYESAIPQGRYPAGIIFIFIKSDLIDINIHPAKREIKFFDSKYIESLIIGLVKKAIGKNVQQLEVSDLLKISESNTSITFNEKSEAFIYPKLKENQALLSFGSSEVNENNSNIEYMPGNDDFKIIGILFKTYILLEKSNEFIIIDFHAAHERINYDRIKSTHNNLDMQSIAFPEHIELSPIMFDRANELIDELRLKGFDIAPFSDNSIIVYGIPTILSGCSVKDFIIDLIETYKNDNDRIKLKQHIISARIACHASRRAGDIISKEEIHFIVKQIQSGKYEFTCPHGRPYIYIMKKTEIEKLFSR
jgi:DNA mismatch repair protein MutL